MLRIPSLTEIRDLFLQAKTVESAVVGLNRAASRLAEVQQRLDRLMARKAEVRDAFLIEAQELDEEIAEHQAERARAARVARRFAELVD